MTKFWELLEASVIVQSLVTLISIGVTAYLVVCGERIPGEWLAILGTVLGYWFGTKQKFIEDKARTDTVKAIDRITRGHENECVE